MPLDLGDPGIARDPHATYSGLRALGAVIEVRWDGHPTIAVTQHAAAEEALKHAGLGREAPELLDPASVPPALESYHRLMVLNAMVMRDPPVSTRLRGLARRALTPLVGEPRARRVAALIDEGLDRIAERDPREPIDLVRDYATPLGVDAITDLLGVPAADRARFRGWALALSNPDPDGDTTSVLPSCEAYLLDLLRAREAAAADDLVSGLVHAEARASPDELVGTCMVLLGAGHHTTAHLIASGVDALLRNRDERTKLASGAATWASAVEELLRYESPVQIAMYQAQRDLVIARAPVAAGSTVAVLLGCANRDPAVFADPDRLDVGRAPNPHLGFGAGPRFCVGAALARLTVALALERLVRRFPRLAFAEPDAPPRWRADLVVRSLDALEVKLG